MPMAGAAGRDHIGVGVGAMVFDAAGRVFLARHVGGEPAIREPDRCTAIGWFDPAEPPRPLSQVSRATLEHYLQRRRP